MTEKAGTVVEMPMRYPLTCSQCGAPGEGSCGCGAVYLSAGEYTERWMVEHPERVTMSNRAIADQIGVDEGTVRNARKKLAAENSAAIDQKLQEPKARVGRDGKIYPAKRRSTVEGLWTPPASNVSNYTVRVETTGYVKEPEPKPSEPAESETPNDVAEYAEVLAELIKLSLPDALALAEELRTAMPDTSPARLKALGLFFVAVAAAMPGDDDDTKPPPPTSH
jgi:hypothetical protein